jgi:hypothetical protein
VRLAPSATATAAPALPPSPASAAPSPAAALPSATPPPSVTAASAASFLGEWDFRADAGTGTIAGTLRFRPDPAGLAGVYVGMRGNATELSNLRVAGNRISFDLVAPRAVWQLEGTLSGDRLEGTFQTAERTIRWIAARKP